MLLKHSKLNCTVYWSMIVSGLPKSIRIVCWHFLNFTFKASCYIFFQIINLVFGPMSDTELLQRSKLNYTNVVDYDSKWFTKFHKDCMLGIFLISLLRRLMIILIFLK